MVKGQDLSGALQTGIDIGKSGYRGGVISVGDSAILVGTGEIITSGGGGGGSSTSSSTAFTNAQRQAQVKAQAEQQRQAQIKAQAEVVRQAQIKATAQAKLQQQKEIFVSSGGGVRVGKTRYIGKAYVPGTGLTANQYSNLIRQQQIKAGKLSKKDYGRASFKITKTAEKKAIPIKDDVKVSDNIQQVSTQNKSVFGNLYGSGKSYLGKVSDYGKDKFSDIKTGVGGELKRQGWGFMEQKPTDTNKDEGARFIKNVIPSLRTMGSDIAKPTKETLEITYGKPKDVSVTRWLSTAVPAKLGDLTTKGLNKVGFSYEQKGTPPKGTLTIPEITQTFYSGIKQTSADITSPTFEFLGKPKGTGTAKWLTGSNLPEKINLPKKIKITSEGAGKGVEVITRGGQYVVPYYGSSLIFGSGVEAGFGGVLGGEKSVSSYVKAHPVEVGIGGLYGGLKAYPFVSGYVATRGRTPVPNQIIPAEVLSGKQTFWSAGSGGTQNIAKQHKTLFLDPKYGLPSVEKLSGYTGKGLPVDKTLYSSLPVNVPITTYHATGNIFWTGEKFIVSESPLHLAPAVSANFLRIGGKSGYPSFSFTNIFKKSGVLSPRINPKDIIIKKGYEAKRGTYIWEDATPPTGKLVIPAGGKTEVQALLLEGTEGTILQQKYYDVYKGVRYPVDEFKINTGTDIGVKEIKNIVDSPKIKQQPTKAYSYSGLPSTDTSAYSGLYGTGTSSLTPSSVVSTPSYSTSSNVLSSVVSTPSYKVSSYISKPSSYKSSKYKSYKSSKPSSSSSPSLSSVVSKPSSYKSSKPSRTSSSLSNLYSSSSSSSSRPRYPSAPTIPKSPFPFTLKGTTLKQPRQQRVAIYGRRFGKWRNIGFGASPLKALTKGQRWASNTLGVSFKIGGKVRPQKLTGFKTKQTKKGTIYIEKLGRRLKRGTREVPEINLYRGLKMGKR